MKKSKILLSVISIFLCVLISFYILSSAFLIDENVKTAGVNSRLLYTEYENEHEIIDYRGYDIINSDNAVNANRRYVFVSGRPVGIKLYCDGVIIVGTEKIKTANGYKNPASEAGIRKGDIIISVDGKKISSNTEFSSVLNNSGGKQMHFVLKRDGEEIKVNFNTVYCPDEEKFKAGLWIRDSSAGIGILTFITENMQFASLGHGVCDVDTGEIFSIGSGEICEAEITAIYKGAQGAAGELRGALEKESIGDIKYNGYCGVYGTFNENSFDRGDYKVYPVSEADEVTVGDVQILTTVENGKPHLYNAEITRIESTVDTSKDFILKITDDELILKTGGIVQGMSGSPVIQNGKLAGAVTHVFVNDPTGGYGIFAETMLDKAYAVK